MTDLVRARLVGPWRKSTRAVDIPMLGADIDGRALATLLGRHQQCHEVLDGEFLLTGIDVRGPRWTWHHAHGELAVCGFGIVVGGSFIGGFSNSAARLHEIEHHIQFPARRARAEAA
jgi:hypothetical protein